MNPISEMARTGFQLVLPTAQASRLDEIAFRMAEGFREEPARFEWGGWWVLLWILAGLPPAVWILGRLARRRHGGSVRQTVRGLFIGLCRAHGLSSGDRRLLERLARCLGLQDPARLFLEPERFDPANLSPRLRRWESRFQVIRQGLFAGMSEEDAALARVGDQAAPVPCPALAASEESLPPGSSAVSTLP